MRTLWRALVRTVFWSFERGTWPYDVAVAVIVLFVLLSPRSWFHDRPPAGAPAFAGHGAVSRHRFRRRDRDLSRGRAAPGFANPHARISARTRSARRHAQERRRTCTTPTASRLSASNRFAGTTARSPITTSPSSPESFRCTIDVCHSVQAQRNSHSPRGILLSLSMIGCPPHRAEKGLATSGKIRLSIALMLLAAGLAFSPSGPRCAGSADRRGRPEAGRPRGQDFRKPHRRMWNGPRSPSSWMTIRPSPARCRCGATTRCALS